MAAISIVSITRECLVRMQMRETHSTRDIYEHSLYDTVYRLHARRRHVGGRFLLSNLEKGVVPNSTSLSGYGAWLSAH